MKKQIRRAMLATVAMMLMGIVSLTGVTYAWFSQSDTAIVGGMDLGIVSKEGGVLISAIPNPDEWAYRLDLNIKETEYNPASMVPANIKSDGTIQFYNGVINESKPSEIYTEAVTQNKYYIEKDVYFYNDSMDSPITVLLDKESTILSDVTNGVDMAMRLAVVDHGVYDKGTTESTIKNFKTTDPEKVSIYEFNAKQHLDASTDAKTTYGVKAESGVDQYFDAKAEENRLAAAGAGATSEYLEKTTTVHKDTTENISFEIPANSYYRVTVYLWLEGQDVDCKNAISGSHMNIQLAFTKALDEAAAQ